MCSRGLSREISSRSASPNSLHPVQQTEVDHLGAAAACSDVTCSGASPNTPGGGGAMDVGLCFERLDQPRVARHVRQHPQLDLRVVRHQETPPQARDEGTVGSSGPSPTAPGCSAGWGGPRKAGRWSLRFG